MGEIVNYAMSGKLNYYSVLKINRKKEKPNSYSENSLAKLGGLKNK